MIVTVKDGAEMEAIAQSLHGQLKIRLELDDAYLGGRLLPILSASRRFRSLS